MPMVEYVTRIVPNQSVYGDYVSMIGYRCGPSGKVMWANN